MVTAYPYKDHDGAWWVMFQTTPGEDGEAAGPFDDEHEATEAALRHGELAIDPALQNAFTTFSGTFGFNSGNYGRREGRAA